MMNIHEIFKIAGIRVIGNNFFIRYILKNVINSTKLCNGS